MLTVFPSIVPEIYRIAPGFQALSICVKAAPMFHLDTREIALRETYEAVMTGEPERAGSHLAIWADVFRKFDAKPKRTPCLAGALRKRVLRDETIPAFDPIVDLYNTMSLRYAVPVGEENISVYQGSPRPAVASGTEPFDTVKEGETAVEYPSQRKVIWYDDAGATRRRWNWRQGIRTRLGMDTQQMQFILGNLPQMPLEKLREAGKMLTDGLEKMMPGLWFDVALIEKQQQ